jgi:HEPN/RES N-terminal domain 1
VSEDVDALKAKRICFACIGEEYFSDEIRTKGERAKCSYCKKTRRSYSVGEITERIETAFQQHYVRTSDQSNDWEHMLLRDRESSYEWYRHGEPVTDSIMNAADIPQAAADDIQKILADKHEDFDLAAMGEETEFADDSYYEEKRATDETWQEEWRSFENSLKTEARFFSRTAAKHLPPVGSQVAVAQFEIIRKLQLLDLTALRDVRVTGSIFDVGLAARLERKVPAVIKRSHHPAGDAG